MARFAYTNQTTFKPFTYQEMVTPLLQATQEHQQVADALSELDSQANAVASLASETDDPVTYQRYKNYEAALRQESDALATQGLTPGTRTGLRNMKASYATEITPIQNAITRRRELADEQRKALLNNPTLMFERDFNTRNEATSLDRFMENVDYDYGNRASGADIAKSAESMAAHLATELSKTGVGRLDDYTKTFIQRTGFTRDEILQAIHNPDTGSPVLRSIVEQAVNASGVKNWGDAGTVQRAYDYATEGLWAAAGRTSITTFDDYAARYALQHNDDTPKKSKVTVKGKDITVHNSRVKTRRLYNSRKRSDEERAFEEKKKKFREYFTLNSDGTYTLNEKGINKYATEEGMTATSPSITGYVTTAPGNTDFKKFIETIAPGINPIDRNNSRTIGDAWGQYLNDPIAATSSKDATERTEYIYDIAPADNELWKRILMRSMPDDGLISVDYDEETGDYTSTGEVLKSLKDADIVSVDYAPGASVTVDIAVKEGPTLRYSLPKSIADNITENLRDYGMYADIMRNIAVSGEPQQLVDRDGDTITITPDEAADEYAKAIKSMEDRISQIAATNQTTPYKWDSGDKYTYRQQEEE